MILNMEFDTDMPFDIDFSDLLLGLVEDPDSVKFTPQEKTEDEKSQARENIGAAVDVIESDASSPTRLADLPEGAHVLTGYFLYNTQSDEDGIWFTKDLFTVEKDEISESVVVQGYIGRTFHSYLITSDDVQHYRRVIDPDEKMAIAADPTPETQVTAYLLDKYYEPSYYADLPTAVMDLNNNVRDNGSDMYAGGCALYTDNAGNTCLVLLSDIDLSEFVTISATSIFKVNGHTINYTGDYSFIIEGDNCVLDLQVEGSQLVKNVDTVAATVPMVRITGSECEILGGSISYEVSSSDKAICAVAVSGSASIQAFNVSLVKNGGTGNVFALQNQNTVNMVGSIVNTKAVEGNAYCVYGTAASTASTLDGCILRAESNEYSAGFTGAANYDSNTILTNCQIESNTNGIIIAGSSPVEINKCTIRCGLPDISSTGLSVGSTSTVSVTDTDVFADGTTGSANDTDRSTGVGISNYGVLNVENCTVYGTHSGISSHSGSTTVINGGTYESCSHGGAYISCVDGNFYAQNAAFRNVPYRGQYKDQFNYTGAVYLVAAVYIGGSSTASNIKAYMDNCVLDGGGPELVPDGDGYIGAEPIRFRASLGETNNAIYASGCTFMGDGKIRFGNSSHHLYLGFGNRVLTEANLTACVDTTTYASKVFTGYEEE